MAIRAVVFDVGETLVDETRAWLDWADWLGIPALTLFGALGSVIERGLDHREAFAMARQGIDLRAEVRRRIEAGRPHDVLAQDLYPDALPALHALHQLGYRLGIAGNQPSSTEAVIRSLGIELDLFGSSSTWGVEKPDPAFFAQVVDGLAIPAASIVYVGDRLDNDVAPAVAAGLRAIFIRRGPWGVIQGRDPSAARRAGAWAVIERLDELPAVLSAQDPG